MIRDVNFFAVGVGAKGSGTWWCHFGYLNNLAGPMLAKKHCSICWGSCSICLLMSAVVGGTHVYHVMRRAGSTFTWRSDHRGKWQPLWQMFLQSWGRGHERPVQSEGLDESLATTAATCVRLCVHPAHSETRRQLFLQNNNKNNKRKSLLLNEDVVKLTSKTVCVDINFLQKTQEHISV